MQPISEITKPTAIPEKTLLLQQELVDLEQQLEQRKNSFLGRAITKTYPYIGWCSIGAYLATVAQAYIPMNPFKAEIALGGGILACTAMLTHVLQQRYFKSYVKEPSEKFVKKVDENIVNVSKNIMAASNEGIALIVTATYDYNGACKTAKTAQEKLKLSEKYTVFQEYVSSVQELKSAIQKTAKEHPKKPIKALVIQAHGMPDALQLGGITQFMSGFEDLESTFTLLDPKAPIILCSCSTGETSQVISQLGGLAQRIANLAGDRTVFAPMEDTPAPELFYEGLLNELKPKFLNKDKKNVTSTFFKTKEILDPTKLTQSAFYYLGQLVG